MRHKDMGLNTDQVINWSCAEDCAVNFRAIKNRLLQNPEILGRICYQWIFLQKIWYG